jgi:hypothetical protein
MSLYLQYHNCNHEAIPIDELPFSRIETGIRTSKKFIQRAAGRVFLIVGIGRPKRFFLWQTFRIKELEEFEDDRSTAYNVYGPGWELAPPQELKGVGFERFKTSCANFVGFRRIDDLPYTKTLVRLAEKFKPPQPRDLQLRFLNRLQQTLGANDPERQRLRAVLESAGTRRGKAIAQDLPRLALSVRQPWAEAIMQGGKTKEYRGFRTHVRGLVYLYAASRKPTDAEWQAANEFYGVNSSDIGRKAYGQILGTVEVVGCKKRSNGQGYAWLLAQPVRFKKPLPPLRQPQPVWFRPF